MIPPPEIPAPSRREPPKLFRPRVISGTALVVIGLGTIAFSGYMLLSSREQVRRIEQLTARTQLLRDTIQRDREWQSRHQLFTLQLERAIRDAVIRKEAMIRAALKAPPYGWDDDRIDRAIREESEHMAETGISNSSMPIIVPPVDPPVDFSDRDADEDRSPR